MRCDVTKFNKKFGICKVGLCPVARCCRWPAGARPSRTPAVGGTREHDCPGPLALFLLPAPWLGQPTCARLRSCHALTTPVLCPCALQMNAKAYVGEDLVCEAELTLVMGK